MWRILLLVVWKQDDRALLCIISKLSRYDFYLPSLGSCLFCCHRVCLCFPFSTLFCLYFPFSTLFVYAFHFLRFYVRSVTFILSFSIHTMEYIYIYILFRWYNDNDYKRGPNLDYVVSTFTATFLQNHVPAVFKSIIENYAQALMLPFCNVRSKALYASDMPNTLLCK